jgi:hypothetical protein
LMASSMPFESLFVCIPAKPPPSKASTSSTLLSLFHTRTPQCTTEALILQCKKKAEQKQFRVRAPSTLLLSYLVLA